MKTVRLYYTECYARAFDAQVTAVETDPRGARVILDRTAFYPASGGQPADRGTLGGAQVLDVFDDGARVVHALSQTPDGQRIHGEIDWDRRFDHMQQHTGQHILSAAFERTGGGRTVSFHMGAESSTIDLDSEGDAAAQAETAETLANQVVFEDREIRILFKDSSEAAALPLRKPTEREGEVRLIEIEDFDLSACGGTHVRRTGVVGLIALRKIERAKGLTRVEFVCGMRALNAARRDYRALAETARIYSAPLEKAPEIAAQKRDELRRTANLREKLVERLSEEKAARMRSEAGERNGIRLVSCVVTPEDLVDAKALARALAAMPGTMALIAAPSEAGGIFFAQSKGGPGDMAALLKATAARFGGKGGGTRDFAQGGGIAASALAEALAFAASLIP